MTKLRDYLRISDAADYLGVSPNTLRNWERAGKIKAHPASGEPLPPLPPGRPRRPAQAGGKTRPTPDAFVT